MNPDPSSAGRPPHAAAGGQRTDRRLAGRRVLVVGGGGSPEGPAGNGHAISVLAAREGAAVAVADIDPRAAAATVAAIEAEGGTAAAVIADVRLPGDCERLVTGARTALGGLDGLVLNVGIGKGLGPAGPGSGARPAGPPGHRLGGGLGRGVPAVRRGELHHRAGSRGGRRTRYSPQA